MHAGGLQGAGTSHSLKPQADFESGTSLKGACSMMAWGLSHVSQPQSSILAACRRLAAAGADPEGNPAF